MATLSPNSIALHAYNAGVRKKESLAIAVAVALGESGGKTDARCHNCFPGVSEDSIGLWQVNRRAHPQYSETCLYDPACNARAMYAISSGGNNWRPWSQYTNGGYKKYLGQGLSAASAVISGYKGGGAEAIPTFGDVFFNPADAPGPLQGVAGALHGASDFAQGAVSTTGNLLANLGKIVGFLSERSGWIRAGEIVGGIALLVIGLRILARESGMAGGGE
jgi:hypothetical protein